MTGCTAIKSFFFQEGFRLWKNAGTDVLNAMGFMLKNNTVVIAIFINTNFM
jgi:hypothetical protein